MNGNGPMGILDRMSEIYEMSLSIEPGQSLQIVVENMGRIHYGPRLNDFKGIISNVTLNCQVTIIVTTSGFQLSKMLSMSQMCLESVVFSYMSQNKKWVTDSVTQ